MVQTATSQQLAQEYAKRRPGLMARLLGGLDPFNSIEETQNRFDQTDIENEKQGFTPDPNDIRFNANVKDLNRSIYGGFRDTLGMTRLNPGSWTDQGIDALGEVPKQFTETVAEKQNRDMNKQTSLLKEEGDAAMADWQGAGEAFAKTMTALNGGEPLGGTGTPFGGGSETMDITPPEQNNPRLDELKRLIAEAKPTEEQPLNTLLRGVLSGLASPSANTGEAILKMGLGALDAQEGARKAKDENKIDYAMKSLQGEVYLKSLQDAMEEGNAPKVYNTKGGLVVEKTVVGEDGKEKRILQPFTGGTYQNVKAQNQVLNALTGGTGKVNIFGISKAINPNEPMALEQAAIAMAEDTGLLSTVFGDIMGGEEWMKIAEDEQLQMTGMSDKVIQESIAQKRLAFLSLMLKKSPKRTKALFEGLNALYGETGAQPTDPQTGLTDPQLPPGMMPEPPAPDFYIDGNEPPLAIPTLEQLKLGR